MAYAPFDLSGRGAVVTGGNGGIGYGMARALLASGAQVAIWGSNPDKTRQAQATLAQECGDASRVHAFVCDVGDESQVERAFADSVAALGRVDSCFANAGVSSKGTLLTEMTLEEFRRVQRVNVEGVFLTFRAAARHILLGESFGADEALALGIASHVVAQGDLAAKLDEVVATLLAKPAEAMRLTQALLRKADRAEVIERMELENGHFGDRLTSDEVRRAITSFFAARAKR